MSPRQGPVLFPLTKVSIVTELTKSFVISVDFLINFNLCQ